MSMRVLLALSLLASLAISETKKKPLTAEAILELSRAHARFSDVTWSPDGSRFIDNDGKHLLLHDAASGKERAVVELEKLDKMADAVQAAPVFDWTNRHVSGRNVQWFPDGRRLLVEQAGDLFEIDTHGDKLKQLTHTPVSEVDPQLSPDGKAVAFRRGHDLFAMTLADGETHQLTQDGSETLLNGELDWVYPEELDLQTAYWWSPDSRHIAYLQSDVSREPVFPQVSLLKPRGLLEPERYPKAGDPNAEVRLGIVAAQGGPSCWMDLGDTRDYLLARVTWLPDAREIAAVRLPRVQNKLDLLIASIDTGKSRTVLHEQDKFWINVEEGPRFLKDGRMLWSSERSGFRHLYLYGKDGALLRDLTSGEWQVNRVVAVNEDTGRLYYTSTETSPVEQQLYSIGLDGSGKQRLTQEAGTHSITAAEDGKFFVDRFSSLEEPPRTVLRESDGSARRELHETGGDERNQYVHLPSEIVKVKAADGATLYGELTRPANFDRNKKYSAVVEVYGGPHAQLVQNRWMGLNLEQLLAQNGFVVWSLDNRGSYGRGHGFETPVYHQLGKQELADQQTGIEHLLSMGFVDPAHIGLNGWSYGGFMTLYTVTHAPGLIQAAVAGAPVTSWRNYDTIYTERYMGLPEENRTGYETASPQPEAGKLKAKLMLIHNIEDDNVHFANTMQMADALERAGKPFSMLVYPQRAHGVSGPVRQHLMEQILEFFQQNLR